MVVLVPFANRLRTATLPHLRYVPRDVGSQCQLPGPEGWMVETDRAATALIVITGAIRSVGGGYTASASVLGALEAVPELLWLLRAVSTHNVR